MIWVFYNIFASGWCNDNDRIYQSVVKSILISWYVDWWSYQALIGLVLWHINHCWLFNAQSCFYIYIIWFLNTFCRYTELNDWTVLFLTIQFSLSQQSSMVLSIAITNTYIKYQSFVYTQLNDQTVLFSISHLFALSLNVKQFYLTHR